METILEVIASLYLGTPGGSANKKNSSVRPFYIIFAVVYLCFIVWLAADL
ncbi:MAG: hypothetical protein H7Y13_02760 [Sphingobacteriaceae bacterium]|nr:hypothetical protein [Sphingobacteriaceae bacterium]